MKKMDPQADAEEWDTELLNGESSDQLKELGKLLGALEGADEGRLALIFAAEFTATGVPSLREVHRDKQFVVERTPPGSDAEAGKVGLREFLRALRTPHDGALARIDLKTYRVERGSEAQGGFTTAVLFQSSSRSVQENAQWTCHWNAESPPRLKSVRVSGLERIRSTLRFVDASGSVLGDSKSFGEQMTVGGRHWAERVQKFYLIDSTAHQGIAVGDADGDGLEDLYLAQPGALPNRLYLRNKDGTLRDASAQAGVDWMELTHGVLFVDLDNDGDQDLVMGQSHQLLLMNNDGAGKFEPGFALPAQSDYFSLAAADYDLDGDLDLYVCGYNPRQQAEYAEGPRVNVPLPYHDSRRGGPNVLLQNDGNWQFSKVTNKVGLDQNNDRHSFAVSWEDYDNDGDPDLYVANDFGRNNLYRNDGGSFVDVADTLGVEDMSAGMGVTWADYNRDGKMDFYVSNMFSAAGNRVTYQRQFRTGASQENLAGFQRHARGNSLFRSAGEGAFEDVSVETGVTMGRWAWGAKFADLNNDGWEDLYVANGYISADRNDDL